MKRDQHRQTSNKNICKIRRNMNLLSKENQTLLVLQCQKEKAAGDGFRSDLRLRISNNNENYATSMHVFHLFSMCLDVELSPAFTDYHLPDRGQFSIDFLGHHGFVESFVQPFGFHEARASVSVETSCECRVSARSERISTELAATLNMFFHFFCKTLSYKL